MLKILLLLLASTAHARPIQGLGILNSPLAQNAKFNVTSGTVRGKLTVGEIFSIGTITGEFVGDLTGNADTATALAADPDDSPSGFLSRGIDASGTSVNAVVLDALTSGATSPISSNAAFDANAAQGVILDQVGVDTAAISAILVTVGIDTAAHTAQLLTVAIDTTTHAALTGSTAHGAVSAATADQIVTRDGSGDFSANEITSNLIGDVTGNADTATALAADGTDAASGFLCRGMDASGNCQEALVDDTDDGVDSSTSPVTANVMHDHNNDADNHGNGIAGNAATATALAADPADSPSGFLSRGIDASGTSVNAVVLDALTSGATSPISAGGAFTADALNLKLTGGTMSGDIGMGDNQILDISTAIVNGRLFVGGKVGLGVAAPTALLQLSPLTSGTTTFVIEQGADASADFLQFDANGATGGQIVRIDSEGRLALGGDETSETVGGVMKDSIITTHSQGGSNNFDIGFHRHSATSGPFLMGFRSRGSEASESIIQDGDNMFDIFALGHDGTDYEFAAAIKFEVDGTPGDGDMPGRILFETTPDGSDTPVERMRIDNTGNVGIGTTIPEAKLHVVGPSTTTGTAIFGAQVLGADGSAAAPSFSFNTDSNSGMYKNATDEIGFTVTGSRVASIDANGIRMTSSGGPRMKNTGSSLTNPGIVPLATNLGTGIGGNSSDALALITNFTNALTIDSSQNVGIGTESPATKLHISSGTLTLDGTSPILRIAADTGRINFARTTPPTDIIRLRLDASDDFHVEGNNKDMNFCTSGFGECGDLYLKFGGASGNWTGIGTVSPDARLNVVGAADLLPTAVIMQVSSNTITDFLTVLNNGNVGIGTIDPDVLTTIDQGASDAIILELQSSDVGQPSTDFGSAESWLSFIKQSSSKGGAKLYGLNDDGTGEGLILAGSLGSSNPTDTVEAVGILGFKNSGTGGQALGALETVLKVDNWTTNMMTVLGSGNVGIGTTSPAAELDVSGNVLANNISSDSFEMKASSESVVASTTLQDDDDFQMALTASSTNMILLDAHIESANSTPDFDYAFTYSVTNSTMTGHCSFPEEGENNKLTVHGQSIIGLEQNVDLDANDAVHMTCALLLEAGPSGDGIFKLQWAQEVSNNVATNIHRASWMRVEDVTKMNQ